MFDFKDIRLKRTYSSIEDDLISEIINPLLGQSLRYDRAVGFFSSSWLKEVVDGLAIFAQKGGKARIVTSIKLSDEDWEAIQKGEFGDFEIQSLIDKQIFSTIDELREAIKVETLATLSWMISQGILEFKFAIPTGKLKGGIFHTKSSLFYDSYNNGIAVFGSQNDSHQATLNEESLNVFTSWDFGKEYFNDHKEDFEKKWSGNSETLRTYNISEASRNKIVDAGSKYSCPYIRKVLDDKILQNNTNKDSVKKIREYQQRAIDNWIDNNYEGLFEMATGSGKTFTSISAASKLYELNGKICLVVLAPYQHLVTQWAEELEMFGFSPILCFKSSSEWQNIAYTELQKYKANIKNKVCFVATHSTSALNPFQEFVKTISSDWMLIADEVHGLGSKNRSIALFPSAKYRIGLSATPQRWFDEEGTERLINYFKKTIIEYGIEDAINAGALTRYEYTPVLIELNELELNRYEQLSNKIGILSAKKSRTQKEQEEFEFLCRQRAAVIGKAENKIPELVELVEQHRKEITDNGEKYLHNLYYCAPGEHKEVLKALSDIGVKVHEFVSDVPQKEREEILKAFTNGDIEGIVAIKCLDEGVDIPATKRAYILASSTNPREFVQRRGRVLRKSHGKNRAYIYDFFVGPWSLNQYSISTAQSLLRRELPRFSEFNSLNEKKYEAIKEVKYACEYFNMINEIDMKPWEVYNKIIANYSDLLINSEDER